MIKLKKKKTPKERVRTSLGRVQDELRVETCKKGSPEDNDNEGDKITAAGGSALNTAVFAQNCTQVCMTHR